MHCLLKHRGNKQCRCQLNFRDRCQQIVSALANDEVELPCCILYSKLNMEHQTSMKMMIMRWPVYHSVERWSTKPKGAHVKHDEAWAEALRWKLKIEELRWKLKPSAQSPAALFARRITSDIEWTTLRYAVHSTPQQKIIDNDCESFRSVLSVR